MPDITAVPLIATIELNGGVTKEVSPSALSAQTELKANIPVYIYAEPLTAISELSANINPYFYVVDSGNNRVQAFNYDGTFAFSFGEYGTGDGQFNNPYGITTDNEKVYVTDSGNNRIEVFDLQGNFLFKITSDEFNNPLGIACDDYFIYVVNNGNNNILVFDKTGIFVGKWGGDDYLNNPVDLSTDKYFLYVDDRGNNRTVVLDKTGLLKNKLISSLPKLSLQGSIKDWSINLTSSIKSLTIKSSGKLNQNGNIQSTLPNLTFYSALGQTINGHLSSLSFNGKSTTGIVLRLKNNLPKLNLISKVSTVSPAEIKTELNKLNFYSKLLTGNSANVSATLKSLSISANLQNGLNSYIKSNIVGLQFSSTSYNDINAELILQLPKLQPNITVRELAELLHKAIVLNTKNLAVTEYKDEINFTSGVYYKGRTILTAEDGVYTLEGDETSANFVLATLDTHQGVINYPLEVYIVGDHSLMNLEYTINDTNTLNLEIKEYYNSMKETRVKFPKGAKSRFVTLNISNTSKKYFKIDELHIIGYGVNRRRR